MSSLTVMSGKAYDNPVRADQEVNRVLREVIKGFPELEDLISKLVKKYPGMGRMAALRFIAAVGNKEKNIFPFTVPKVFGKSKGC